MNRSRRSALLAATALAAFLLASSVPDAGAQPRDRTAELFAKQAAVAGECGARFVIEAPNGQRFEATELTLQPATKDGAGALRWTLTPCEIIHRDGFEAAAQPKRK